MIKKTTLKSCFAALLIFQLIFFVFPATAQHCGTDEILKRQLRENPLLKARHLQAESQILNRKLSNRQYKTAGVDDYVIPVVVHIIHKNGAENISNAQVLAGLQHMNQAFSNLGLFSNTLGTVTGIQFCLAKQDENGNASSGITRTVSNLTDMLSPSQDLALKDLIRWDPNNYLNIWLVNEITSESAGAGVAGYAYFPSAHGTAADGVVNEARYFGSSPDNSKIHIHELGHYLGLYHTFEGGCPNNNCLTEGDRVCDTPPDASVSPVLCPIPVNTCTTDSDDPTTNNPFRPIASGGTGDQNDMIINYMDYGLDICRIIFTEGQKERMVSSLTLIRRSLLKSNGCEDPCPNPISLNFTPADTTVLLGTTVNFTNTSTGATSYQWSVNGTLFAGTQNASHTFTQQGKHIILLTASNANSVCTKKDSFILQVKCSVLASFSAPQKVKPGEAITFTNTTPGTNTYQWFLGSTLLSTNQNLVYTFAAAGGFMISLVAYNGSCYDTLRKFVQVGACNPGNNGDNWYFGSWVGLKFSGGAASVVALPIGGPTIYMYAQEGCVSMSDASGNFMFFANPQFVFNKNFTQMPNGSGLLGDLSATQITTVQKPGNPNIYYLFTLDDLGGPDGLRYSEIDMTLNGGLGDVVAATKNTLMVNSVTEKITAVKHANGIDTWVIAHEYGTNSFFSYLVSSAGVSAVPVVSSVGTIHAVDTYNQNVVGQLKVSPDGCRLALAISGLGTIELLNFNNLTGAISNPVTFNSPDYQACYGVEFSPDGSKLYVGMEDLKNIYQFNLNAGNASAILNSRYLVGNTGVLGRLASFQIGPYGKIYMARNGTQYISVINNPNAAGAGCEFESNGILLPPGRQSSSSLPSFNQAYFYDPKPSIAGPDTICVNSTNIAYKISGSTCSPSINAWSLIGNGTLVSSNDTLAKINFNQAGKDTLVVQRTAACGVTYDTLVIVIVNTPLAQIKDTMQCSSGSAVVLDAGAGFAAYRWQDNSTLQTYSVLSPGKYWVNVTNRYGCSVTDTIRVSAFVPPSVSLGSDSTMCRGTILVVDAGNYAHYDWQDHSTNRTYSIFTPGKYWVTVTDYCGNKASDTILVKNTTTVNLGNDTELCTGESIVLDAGSGFKNYIWQDGSTQQTFSVSSKGSYWVIATSQTGCFDVDTLIVSEKTNCCNMKEIPNLVTLNNDGSNDKFAIPCIEHKGWTLEVYNRWGDLVYKNKDYNNEWPIVDVSDGVYFYLVKKEEKSYRGWVEIIR